MCGVAVGAFGQIENMSQNVDRINTAQQHRGPDATHKFIGKWFVAGHTRLSINGLGESGRQPMFSRDGKWCVVYNGEIYNHRELETLYKLDPISTSDGGVIPELLSKIGIQTFSQVRGMFAITAINLQDEYIYLAVDPFGIKPLHWKRDEEGLLIASEPLHLRKESVQSLCSQNDISRYLLRGALAANETGVEGINRVTPGTVVKFVAKSSENPSNCFPVYPTRNTTWQEVIKHFEISVTRHMISEVPIALLLSDGVDSTALAIEMSKQGFEFNALTIDFGNQSRNESVGANETAKELGLAHQIISTVPDQSCVESFFDSLQRPTIDGLNNYIVLNEVKKQGFRVAISGLGADESLTGYVKNWMPSAFSLATRFPESIGSRILNLGSRENSNEEILRRLNGVGNLHHENGISKLVSFLRQVWTIDELEKLLSENYPKSVSLIPYAKTLLNGKTPNSVCATQTSIYLAGQLLPDADAFSMAHSIELRVPYLDIDFVQCVMSIKSRRLTKKDFVLAYGSELLNKAASRPKLGFSIPMDSWMRNGLLELYVRQLENLKEPIFELIDYEISKSAIKSWESGSIHWSKIWALVVLNEWMKRNA